VHSVRAWRLAERLADAMGRYPAGRKAWRVPWSANRAGRMIFAALPAFENAGYGNCEISPVFP
jgi:hypothetical protein